MSNNWDDDYYGNDIFETMKGKTIIEIEDGQIGDEHMQFIMEDGSKYDLRYDHDCCASATIEDICGDLQDIIGSPLLVAEVVVNDGDEDGDEDGDNYGTHTWTFYKLDTIKGGVTIRWLGESNGYYSERVTCVKYEPEDKQ